MQNVVLKVYREGSKDTGCCRGLFMTGEDLRTFIPLQLMPLPRAQDCRMLVVLCQTPTGAKAVIKAEPVPRMNIKLANVQQALLKLQSHWRKCVPALCGTSTVKAHDSSLQCIITEHLGGQAAATLPEPRTRELKHKASAGYQKVLGCCVLHGDTRPENIVVEGDDVHVIDFGSSKVDMAEDILMVHERERVALMLGISDAGESTSTVVLQAK